MPENKKELNIISTMILKYFAYMLLLVQCISTIFGIIGINFVILNKCYPYKKWLILVIIIVIIIGLPFLFLKKRIWERLGSWLFKKRISDTERFFYMSPKDENMYYRELLFSCLSGSDRDDKIINILRKEATGNDSVYAIKMGLHNSRLFYILGNDYLRVLNGIWTIVAVNKANSEKKIKHDEYIHAKVTVLIDDIGWTLSKIDISQYNHFCLYIDHNVEDLHSKGEIKKIFLLDRNIKESAIHSINYGISLLNNYKNDFNYLRATAYRHLSSLSSNVNEAIDYSEKSNEEMKKIRSSSDKKKMERSVIFVKIEQKLSVNNYNKEELSEYSEKLDKIWQEYKDAEDFERVGKCYCISAKILLAQQKCDNSLVDNKNNIINILIDGIKYNYENIRYDELLNCYLELAKYYVSINEIEKAKKEAREGYKFALTLRNRFFINEFSKIYLPKRIILFRHGEAEKNINAIINGSGNLTEQGKNDVQKSVIYIKNYLEKQGYNLDKINIYGCIKNKQQVQDTLEVFCNNNFSNIQKKEDNLQPTYMGILAGKSELQPTNEIKKSLNNLQRWRNNNISLSQLQIEGMELPDQYWARGKSFIDSIKENECSIIVCTTSIAILLIHCLTMDKLKLEEYKHINVPLCGMINFIADEDEKYSIVNKDYKRNILFNSLEENAKELY